MLTPVFKNLFFKSVIEIKSTSNNLCSSFWYCGRSRHQKCSIKTVYLKFCKICTSNHMFKRETWDKFTELTFLKFWNLPSETSEISKFQKMNEVNFPQISRINMWFLVNHMWQALEEHTKVRITQKTISHYQQI